MGRRNTVHVLLVEDDEVDALAVERGFRRVGMDYPLHRAVDGVDALARLRGTHGHLAIPGPRVVLLDLALPRMGGHAFLEALRSDPDPALRRTIVFVMTGSAAEEDRLRAYDHNVAGYILKSDPVSGLLDALAMLDSYLRVVELP